MINYYQEKISQYDKKIHQRLRTNTYYTIVRGILFLCILFSAYYSFEYLLFVCVFILCVLLFIVIVILFKKNKDLLNYYRAHKKIYENEIENILYHRFPHENGLEFQDIYHPFANDLDIFGECSVFHLLNRCRTTSGRNYLAQQLSNLTQKVDLIYRRQEAIKDLKQEKDFIFHLLALLSLRTTPCLDNENLFSWICQSNQFKVSKSTWWLIHILPTFNFLFLIAAIIHSHLFFAFFLCLLCQGFILNKYEKKIATVKHNLNVVIDDVNAFNKYAEILKTKHFQSSLLQQIQQQMINYHQSIRWLQKMLSVFDIGDSAIGFFSNTIFFSHIKTAIKLEKWRETNRTTFPQIIEYIGELELLFGLTIFHINHPAFIFPEFLSQDSEVMLETKEIGHPLLFEKQRITNDVAIRKNNVFIITGANMAGKSTFLRTIGVNVILAHIGAPVCATSFRCIPLLLFTSMRTIDNLDKGISYFYAEVLRIREMLDFIQPDRNVLLVVDELFRGTNSDDRLKSSLSFLKKLTAYPNIASLIATHDLGITRIEKDYPEKIKNYCFECINSDDQLTFDYKLKEGITQSCNAYRLLQTMHIVD
ncbi:MAG: hypothetical protein LBE11_07915 [Prevotellaceae bacterium]|jgi:ABC-type multidrug transport system fused ATPase/permease subunit|nr:hypothetical protein [Prevotellaceae bacterium]